MPTDHVDPDIRREYGFVFIPEEERRAVDVEGTLLLEEELDLLQFLHGAKDNILRPIFPPKRKAFFQRWGNSILC